MDPDEDQLSDLEGPLEATFTAGATTPSDELYVTVDSYDGGEHQFGPVIWQPGPDGSLPAEGDLALIIESDQETWWVLSWTPATVPVASSSFASFVKWGTV